MKDRKVFLALIVIIFFSICSISGSAWNDALGKRGMKQSAPSDEWDGKGSYYKTEHLEAPEEAAACIWCGDKVYYRNYRPPFHYSISDGRETIYDVQNMFWDLAASDDSLWILENKPTQGQDFFYVVKKPLNGQEIQSLDVKQMFGYDGRARSLFCTEEWIAIVFEEGLAVLYSPDEGSTVQVSLPEGYEAFQLYSLSSGLYLAGERTESTDIYRIHPAGNNTELLFSAGKGKLFADQEADCFLLASNERVDRLGVDGTATPLIVWEECNLAVNQIKSLQAIGNDKYLLQDGKDFEILSPADPAERIAKQQLTIAALDASPELIRFASGFNAGSENYYVKILDYSNQGSYNRETAQLRLNTDIISGRGPDMIAVSSVSPFPLIRKGMLTNLMDLIAEDEEINPEDIVIADALTTDDGLFYFANGFYIETRKGLYSRFGDRNGWTLEEYLELEKTLPPDVMTIYNMTMDVLLEYIIPRHLEACVDWETSTCNFNDVAFISLIKLGKQMRETPEDPDNLILGGGTNSILSGKVITSMTAISNVWTMAEEEYQAGTKLSYVGWPTVDGSCGSDVILYAPVGIMSASRNVHGCWEFLKYVLTHPAEYMPVYRPALIDAIKEAKEDKDIQKFFTDEQADKVLKLISQLKNVKLYDETIMNIIRTECDSFLYGTRTAEETAAIIQSKVSLYLAEQRK